MPLNKQRGNMYGSVTHTWNPVGGECPNACSYCYVDAMKCKPVIAEKYSGPLRLIEKELRTDLGSGNKIFVGSMNDMWLAPDDVIKMVLNHCEKYPDNRYLFQSKDPLQIYRLASFIPKGSIAGSTIESDFTYQKKVSKAPHVRQRAITMHMLKKQCGLTTFITLEPLLIFVKYQLVDLIKYARPDWVNIGADSKGHHLPEPTWAQVQDLIAELEQFTEVRLKDNLQRLKGAA